MLKNEDLCFACKHVDGERRYIIDRGTGEYVYSLDSWSAILIIKPQVPAEPRRRSDAENKTPTPATSIAESSLTDSGGPETT